MRSVLFLAIAALALFAGLSAASPTSPAYAASAGHVASSSDLLAQYVENEPSAMFSRRQLAERPSRVKSKKLAARASPTPVSYNYNIQLISADGSVLGYMDSPPSDKGSYWQYTTSKSSALAVAAPSSGASSNLQFASSGNNMFSAAGGNSDQSTTMGSGRPTYTFYTSTVATPPGSIPVVVSSDFNTANGDPQRSESAVWQYDSSSGALNVVWVNPNGSKFTLQHVVSRKKKYLASPGDPASFRSEYTNDTFDSVTLKLVKI